MSLRFNFDLTSMSLRSLQKGKSTGKGKGKASCGDRERENPGIMFEARFHLTITARTHARTKRNDFPVRGACLKADSLPPTSDQKKVEKQFCPIAQPGGQTVATSQGYQNHHSKHPQRPPGKKFKKRWSSFFLYMFLYIPSWAYIRLVDL